MIINKELVDLKVQADVCGFMKISLAVMASRPFGARYALQERVDSGNMDVADAADEYEELSKKEQAFHEAFVRQAHVRQDGSPRRKHPALRAG